jgi:hypothetical protein
VVQLSAPSVQPTERNIVGLVLYFKFFSSTCNPTLVFNKLRLIRFTQLEIRGAAAACFVAPQQQNSRRRR